MIIFNRSSVGLNRLYAIFFTVVVGLAFVFVGCTSDTTTSDTTTSAKKTTIKETQTGLATYYGRGFDGKKAAGGETFNRKKMVAAHPTYPFGTVARIIHLKSGDTVRVRIVDRGPTKKKQARGVIIDLSEAAAEKLDMVDAGRAQVKVEVLQWGANEAEIETAD